MDFVKIGELPVLLGELVAILKFGVWLMNCGFWVDGSSCDCNEKEDCDCAIDLLILKDAIIFWLFCIRLGLYPKLFEGLIALLKLGLW